LKAWCTLSLAGAPLSCYIHRRQQQVLASTIVLLLHVESIRLNSLSILMLTMHLCQRQRPSLSCRRFCCSVCTWQGRRRLCCVPRRVSFSAPQHCSGACCSPAVYSFPCIAPLASAACQLQASCAHAMPHGTCTCSPVVHMSCCRCHLRPFTQCCPADVCC
jgi:hypothetical protein